MPPRKSTSSVTPGDMDESSMLSIQGQSIEKPITATEQQIKARAELGVSVDDYLLPRSLTIRLAKSVLPPNTTIQKDAVLAIQKAATVFVSYLASHANDATLKRTLNPADVFSALSELEFGSFRERLEQELEAYSEIKAGKRKSKKSEGGEVAVASTAEAAVPHDGDNDVEMADNPAKRMKRDSEVVAAQDDGDETQEEEMEDEAEEEEDEAEEEEEEDDGADERRVEYDVDRVEDLDARPRHVDPDADETDDDDGPAHQLRDDTGLG